MKTYINELHIKGDIENITKAAVNTSDKALILYNIIVKTVSRFKDKETERLVSVDFWREDEDKELDKLKTGDHIFIWGKIDSKVHEGKYYTKVKGYHYQLLDSKSAVHSDAIKTETADEDLPF